ncbi:WD40 repeat domain-containing protein [Actinomadura litoris]|uniref:WD40 repeat domain-containing protein n=1 Tax=Actinomadura litoris TaxID=2678616 RepID=UPI001FA7C4DF|nr:hypothetical protein [Actinomadura litoris]
MPGKDHPGKDQPERNQEAPSRVPARFGAQIVPPLGEAGVEKVVCGRVDGRPVALTLEDDGGVRVWDMGDHRQVGRRIYPRGHSHHPQWGGLAYAELDERSVVVLVSGGLWVFDLSTRRMVSHAEKLEERSPGRPVLGLCDVACVRLGERLVAVTGGYGQAVWIWDVATGEYVGGPLEGHSGAIRSVVGGVLNGRPIAVTADDDGEVRVWDLARQEQLGGTLTGHTGAVYGLEYGHLDGRPVILTGGRDGTVRLWDLSQRDPVGVVLAEVGDRVDAVALTAMDGRALAVSGGQDVRVWDLRTRRQVAPPLFDGRDLRIHSLACGTLHGRPVVLAVCGYHHKGVRVWDLREHRRLGADACAPHASQLPQQWTDPATGDAYDLTLPLIDRAGDGWEVVDYDGIEPIVCQYPLDPSVTFGIADAHAEYDFGAVVTPEPRRPTPSRETHSTIRQYYEFQILEGESALSAERLSELQGRYPDAKLSPTRMVWDFDPDDDDAEETEDPGPLLDDRERDELLRSSFDAYLEFQACGDRILMFCLPTSKLDKAALQPFLAGRYDGLGAREQGSDLLLSFIHSEADGELAHWREQPNTWLKPLLPLYADLAGGDLSAAYLGWLKAAQEEREEADPDPDAAPDAFDPPPRPDTLHTMSPQLKNLARLLHLDNWAKKHLP